MTPQEQYPKFFSHPHYWIGLEIECIKSFAREFIQGNEGEVLHVNYVLCIRNNQMGLWDNYVPKFKPQEGEQFIKDLEVAVSAGLANLPQGISELTYHVGGNGVIHDFSFMHMGDICLFSIDASNIAQCYCIVDIAPAMSIYADYSAYTDKLRELGYYV